MNESPGRPVGRKARKKSELTEAMSRKIKGLRAERGLSQDTMAFLTGISYTTYRKLESGASIIDIEQHAKIARALEVDPEDLYEMAMEEARARAERETRGDMSDQARYRRLQFARMEDVTPDDARFFVDYEARLEREERAMHLADITQLEAKVAALDAARKAKRDANEAEVSRRLAEGKVKAADERGYDEMDEQPDPNGDEGA